MRLCPACASPVAEDFAYCPRCGIGLADPARAADERRTVTALFCDLVGFTALSEAADPEDVDACVRAYGARAREVIERHGGVVEKFIGDAVFGLFGVPLAHEDDAERAVRAALRLVRDAAEIAGPNNGTPLQARAGVNTGLVLVRGHAAATPGQGVVTGDAVNLAARLQAAAPPGAVLAGALTHELSRRVVRYEPLAPFTVKGKAEPVEAWLALAPVSRTGAAETQGERVDTPFVGRDVELAALEHGFDEALRTSRTQVALVTGNAGMGKSRLVAELARRLDARPELVTWRQGRCLPYDEGAGFGAFAEVVKSHAGILETDAVETRRVKLDAALPAVRDREWLCERLGALAGVPAPDSTAEANAAACGRFVAALAEARPLVLVFEDIHRADDAFLSFVDEVARIEVGSGAMLLVLTARPEVVVRKPAFLTAGGGPGRTQSRSLLRVALAPLGLADVRSIVAAVGGGEADEGFAERVVRVAGGNPLYAEEATRLVTGGAADVELPASLAAVYGARLDGLPAAQRDVLSTAAVIGATFWDGAVCSLEQRSRRALRAELDRLEEAGLLHAERASTMAGEREYTFVHAIAREVAYERLTRDARARRHAAVADWLDEKAAGDERALAGELAHHRSLAFRLAQSAGEEQLARELRRPAVRSLRAAGLRAKAIDMGEAERCYGLALELADEDDPLRPTLLAEWGKALFECGRVDEARSAVASAVAGFLGAAQPGPAAVWSGELAGILVNADDPGWREAQDESERLAAGLEPCEEKAQVVLGAGITQLIIENDEARARATAAEYARLVGELGLDESGLEWLQAELQWRSGDRTGLETLRKGELAHPSNEGGIAFCHASLAFEGAPAALAAVVEHVAYFERTANTFCAETFRAMLAAAQLWAGDWDAAVASADVAAGRLREAGLVGDLMNVRLVRLLHDVWTGVGAAPELVTEVADRIGAAAFADHRFWCAVASAAVARADGRLDQAREWVFAAAADAHCSPEYVFLVYPESVRLALALGELSAAQKLAVHPKAELPVVLRARVTASALLAEAEGRREEAAAGFAEAAVGWRDFGVPYEEGQALFGQGRCLAGLSRRREAESVLSRARDVFSRLGARPALAEVEGTLARLPRKAPRG